MNVVFQEMWRKVIKKYFTILLAGIYGVIVLASLIDSALYLFLYIKLFTSWNKLIFKIVLIRGGIPSSLRDDLVSMYSKQLRTMSLRNFLRSMNIFGR